MLVPYYLYTVFLSCVSQARRNLLLLRAKQVLIGIEVVPVGLGVSFFKFGRCFLLSDKRYKMVVDSQAG